MMNTKSNIQKWPLINSRLTQRIIALHESGYTLDFHLQEAPENSCKEEIDSPLCKNFFCRLVDQCFDEFSCSYRYLHTIETFCGKKGMLLSDQPLTFPEMASKRCRQAFASDTGVSPAAA